ncbi:hypothetical protein BCV69DRAFT_285341 [Microstroma glucosiphilum]|uniref:DFDF domain-containing protein n=1 Tax=Pseudomicrostroma glucosiphilum TaxID=1684307 RepID=A0A316TXA5_9BASI|nr:hypothetical protein BCV69DRAFT_285341 [Pseudomicrostroma glucosiphilum]PWN18046.1 hypothetical protein BCV69DRAFT_285341 [Pseudomicrostroma glucosiphilum]
MASSYIGLHVSLALNDAPQPLVGTITQIDVERNLLVLTRQGGGEPVQVDKARIRGISVVPATAESQSTAPAQTSSTSTGASSSSSNSNGAGATDFRAPEATKLPKPSRGGRAGAGQSNEANGVNGSSSASSRRKKKGGKKAGNGSGGAAQGLLTSEEGREHDHGHTRASSSLSEDFDFEASAKSFDKAAIWEQIRAQDRSDPAALLVSHNRRGGDAAAGAGGELGRGRSGTPVGMGEGGKMRKLRIDENVLSPSPDEEKSEEKGGLAVAASAAEAPSVQQPVPALTSTTTRPATGSEGDSEALQREIASLRRRLYILENLSGLSIQDPRDSSTSTGTDQQVEFQVALSPPALPGTSPAPTPGPKSEPVTFYLQTSLELSEPKLRFKPKPTSATASASASLNGLSSASGKLPEKYNREMGLRLDNGSARVFMERLRGAL